MPFCVDVLLTNDNVAFASIVSKDRDESVIKSFFIGRLIGTGQHRLEELLDWMRRYQDFGVHLNKSARPVLGAGWGLESISWMNKFPVLTFSLCGVSSYTSLHTMVVAQPATQMLKYLHQMP